MAVRFPAVGLTFKLTRRSTVIGVSDLRISQLAERTGVPATTLRFYDSTGLLPADRTPGGYRVYGEDAVKRLGFITTAKRLGLPLEEIAELLHVWADGSCAPAWPRGSPRPSSGPASSRRSPPPCTVPASTWTPCPTGTSDSTRNAVSSRPDPPPQPSP